MVTCVVCGKGIQSSLRRLLHPPSSDGAREVRDFYIAHLDPLFGTSGTEQTFACRQPFFVKLEQAQKHTAKASTILTELKAIHEAENDSYAVVSVLLSSSSPQTVKNVGQRSVAQ